jgi:hypothetical protein
MLGRGGGGPVRRLKEVLPQALPRNWKGGLRRGQVLAYWKRVAGSPLDRLTEAVRLEEGVLFVEVPDPVLLHHLTYARMDFLRRFEEAFPGVVREIRFTLGRRLEAGPSPEASRPQEEDLEAQKKAQALSAAAPPGLRAVVERAALALLKGRQGEPCPICETPSPVHPCPTCRRLLEDPVVEKEARRLAQGRPPRLEGEAHRVALHLAKERLKGQLLDLFPQAVGAKEEREALLLLLSDLARRYAALAGWEAVPQAVRSLIPHPGLRQDGGPGQ